jgi:trans-2,3-dihydro-3-hydroxyanthranilate isomerase
MKTLEFFIVDVFAEEPLTGNQLAVFLDAAGLSSEQMQRLAREMNYSETTFVPSSTPREGAYEVRIFTPAAEIPFAGHPTLGTAFLIRQELVREPVARVVLDLRCGQVPVDFTDRDGEVDLLWMHQPEPSFGRVLDAAAVHPVLGLERSDFDERLPVQEVSTGLPFIIVPLCSLAALKRAAVRRDAYFQLIAETQAKAILVFTPYADSRDDLTVRVFTEYYGVPEDPATGSANGALAAYLCHYQGLGSDRVEVSVSQGAQIRRPSRLFLRARREAERIAVSVGGRVKRFARGRLELSAGEIELGIASGRP